jgi:metal iron transporter
LYPLYIISEIAIISTDLAELLGSAIALNLLFPKLPLWAGVLLTAFDVLFILAFSDPLHGRPVRSFELIIGILVRTFIIAYATAHISLETGIGSVDMHVHPCFKG